MKPTISRTLGTGTLIGFLGGVCTGAASFLFLIAYALIWPNEHLGSTAALGPFMVGIWSAILGTVLGAILGGLAWAVGIDLKGPVRCGLFGILVMGALGLDGVVETFQDNPERASGNALLMVGLTLISSLVGGAVGGAVVGAFRREPRHLNKRNLTDRGRAT